MSLSLSPSVELNFNRFVVLLLALVMLVPAAVFAPQAEDAKAASPCDLPFADKVCDAVSGGTESGKDLITGGADVLQEGAGGAAGVIGKEVGKQVGKVLEKATSGVFDQLTSWVGEAAGWFFLKVTALITQTTSPNLFQKSFVSKYWQIAALAGIMAVMVTLIAASDAARRGDVQGLYALFGRIPAAVIAMCVAVMLIQLSLNLVDALCVGVARSTHADIQHWFKAGADWMVEGTAGRPASAASGNVVPDPKAAAQTAAPGFVLLISALLGVIGAFGLWLELLMRDAAIYVCAVFVPLSLAASIWPKWAGAMKKTMEILIVLVVSKFFLVFVISLAASFLGKPDSVETMLAGSAMMIAGLLVPFFLMKLVPFVEAGQMTRGPAAIAQRAASTSSQMSMMRRNMAVGGGGQSKLGSATASTLRPQGGSGAKVPSGTGPGAGVGAAATTAAGTLGTDNSSKGANGVNLTSGVEPASTAPIASTAPTGVSSSVGPKANAPMEASADPAAPSKPVPARSGSKPASGAAVARSGQPAAAQPKPARPSPTAGASQEVEKPSAPTKPRPKRGLNGV